MATNKVIKVTVNPTLTGDTIASYNVYSSVDGLLGAMTIAEAAAGKLFALSDGVSHNITVKGVWTTGGETTTEGSNVVVVDLSSSYILDTYSNSAAAYSLRKLKAAAAYSVRVRRNNDQATTDVLVDDTGSLTLSSIVSSGGSLGTWVGANSAFINIWYDQSENGFDIPEVGTGGPRIINAGALDTKGALSSINFNGTSQKLEKGNSLLALDDGNPFSIFTVCANTAAETVGVILTTTDLEGDKLNMLRDSRATGKGNVSIKESGVTSDYLLSVGRSDTDQVLQSFITNGTLRSAFDNGAAGGTDSVDNGSYINENLRIGVQLSGTTYLAGQLQEIIIFSTDKTSDRVAIESDINNHYSIF